jgi:hypothetical protein
LQTHERLLACQFEARPGISPAEVASAQGQYHAYFEIQYIVVRRVPALDSVGMVDHAEPRISTLEDLQCLSQLGTRQVDQRDSPVMVVAGIQHRLTTR